MTQEQINTIKRECFPDLVKLADELEDRGYFVDIDRLTNCINLYCSLYKGEDTKFINFQFYATGYDTIREANTAFQKQLKAFRKEVLSGE